MNNKYIYNIKKRIARTIGKQKLLSDGDKVLVALSGGKDSMILLESLVECKKHLPFKVDLMACHVYIDNMGYETDIQYLTDFCHYRGVEFVVKQFQLEVQPGKGKSECFLCSWNRRKALFELSKERNCNKIAFGHHMDDALQTLFMNMVYHGSISSMPYQFSMFGNRIVVIRPLLDITEEELIKYDDIQGYKKELKKCRFEQTKRMQFRDLINTISSSHPVAKKNMFRAMNNIFPEYLPHWKK
jgi:tRNA 2-thiocytidine biosynthesis protein TtcA